MYVNYIIKTFEQTTPNQQMKFWNFRISKSFLLKRQLVATNDEQTTVVMSGAQRRSFFALLKKRSFLHTILMQNFKNQH